MKTMNYVVVATDGIAEVLKILCRVNYDNDKQAAHNLKAARRQLLDATVIITTALGDIDPNWDRE
jgi:CHAD domain-containing protein